MDAAGDQWQQELRLVKPVEMVSFSTATISTTTGESNTCTTTIARPQMTEKRGRPQKEQALNCPRCNSTITKFCYYNNYSLTQPRYFCKTCRRYWTEGGSLRNVPIGGGSRKNKRLSLSSSTIITRPVTPTAVSNSKNNPPITELNPPPVSFSAPHHDLNLAFPHHHLPELSEFANLECNSSGASATGVGAFAPLSLPEFPAGFELQELRDPALNFPWEGSSGQYARLLFP